MDTNDTGRLLAFLDKHFKKLYKKMTPIFSTRSVSGIEPLMKYIIDAHKHFSKTEVKENPSAILNKNEMQMYHFVPKPFQEIIESYGPGKSFSFQVLSKQITVFFFTKDHSKHSYNEYIEKIYLWLYAASKYSNLKCSQQLNIYLYLTDEIKLLPEKGSTMSGGVKPQIIKEMNANTGFTTSCKSQNEIHIYREEEWFKVFIHETFHNLGMDFADSDIKISCKKLFSHFPVQSDMLFYETYCEVWAEIIYAIFVGFFENQRSQQLDKWRKKTEKILIIIQLFSIFQCVKVLHHNGMTYSDLYDMSKNSEEKRRQYKEDTEVLSYYVFKSVLLYHYNDFIEWCGFHNGKKIIQFTKTAEIIGQYCDLIIYTYKFHNEKFVSVYSEIEEEFKKRKRFSQYEFMTLRMTPF